MDRNAAKQKRQTRNRQVREARAARTAAAKRASAEEATRSKPGRGAKSGSRASTAKTTAGRGTASSKSTAGRSSASSKSTSGRSSASKSTSARSSSSDSSTDRADRAAAPKVRRGFLGFGGAKAAQAVKGEGSGSDSPSRRAAQPPAAKTTSSRSTSARSASSIQSRRVTPSKRAGASPAPRSPSRRPARPREDVEPPTGVVSSRVFRLRSLPGGTWVGLSFLAAVVTFGMLIALPVYQRPQAPVPTAAIIKVKQTDLNTQAKAEGKKAQQLETPKTTFESVRLLQDASPVLLVLFGVPMLITGFAVFAGLRGGDPTRVWIYLAVALAACTILFLGPLGMLALPAVGALGYGAYRAWKEARANAVYDAEDVDDDLDDEVDEVDEEDDEVGVDDR